ncbi:MAG: hypothetical protein ABFD89_29490 [Bryobacteraceae bacterium]|jgi:hypothetical protein
MDERTANSVFRSNLRLVRGLGWKLIEKGHGWLVNDADDKPVTSVWPSPALALSEAVMFVRFAT